MELRDVDKFKTLILIQQRNDGMSLHSNGLVNWAMVK